MKFSLTESFTNDELSVYFTKSYQELFARIYNSKFKYIKIDHAEKTFFLPIIIRKLSQNNYEAFSSYGYGGLIGEGEKLSDKEIKNLKYFLSQNKIHSLFIRHSPFLENHNFWPNELLEKNRITYGRYLGFSSDFISFKKCLRQKIRASINHAEKNNFSVNYEEIPLENSLKEFHELYLSRMIELRVSKFYYFDYKFFKDHFNKFPKRCRLITIHNINSKVVAGGLFLCDPKSQTVHYHLSASSREGLSHQCNELLISYAIFIFGKDGYKKINLGGGIKFDESDGLSRFKRKFSDFKKVFYITKLICNSNLYFETRNFLKIHNEEFFLIGDSLENKKTEF